MGPETSWAWAGFPGRGTVCTLGGVFRRGAGHPPTQSMQVPALWHFQLCPSVLRHPDPHPSPRLPLLKTAAGALW